MSYSQGRLSAASEKNIGWFPKAVAQLVPQEQSGPHVHGEQVQFELEQLLPWPQVQVGLQVHGEQVHVGFSQVGVLMTFILSQG